MGVFQGNQTDLTTVDIQAPIGDERRPMRSGLMESFRRAAEEAERQERGPDSEVYRFLQAIFSLCPRFDTPEAPFGPMWEMHNKRSLIPEDLTPEDLDAIRTLATRANHPVLLARLFDLIWIKEKDHRACGNASTAYMEAAVGLVRGEDWVEGRLHYQRALHLAGRLGRDKELFGRVSESVIDAIRELIPEEDSLRSLQLMKVMIAARVGDPMEFAERTENLALRVMKSGDFYTARACWEVKADWQRIAKDPEGVKATMQKVADLLVAEADQRSRNGGEFSVGASLLAQGIEVLRQAGGASDRIEQLKKLLADYQEKSMAEMGHLGGEVDVTDLVINARKSVRGHSFFEALRRLAFGRPLANVPNLRKEVEHAAEQFPISHLFNGIIVDDKGRPIAKRGGLLGATTDNRESAQESEMFHHAAMFHWTIRAVSFIEPARQEIQNEHHPNFQDLMGIVRNNSFIPSDHEEIFLRGLHAGFHGDFLVASHILVPQVENSLRHLLEQRGVNITNLYSDGTQPVKVLGALLGLEETRVMLGEDMCFELRGILIEKVGYDFRNRVAHGFVSSDECQSVAAVNAWWIILRLCLIGFHLALQEPEKTSGEP